MSDVRSIPDAELIRRVIDNQRASRRGRLQPLWASVGDRFSLGSTYATQLCRRFGFDPEQQVKG